jgi:hypothetical protein
MTLKERLEFCSICEKRHVDFKTGLVCSLTNEKPSFENSCEDFSKDAKEAERKLTQKLKAAGNAGTQNGSLHPKRNYLWGLLVLILGFAVIIFSLIIGSIMIFAGISFIAKGFYQKKALMKNQRLEQKISQS